MLVRGGKSHSDEMTYKHKHERESHGDLGKETVSYMEKEMKMSECGVCTGEF